MKRQIDFLHKKQGASEWSGELITSEKGTINDLNDWEITAEEIFLADLGSPGFTGYEVDKGGFKSVDIVEMYEAYPGLLDGTKKNHHIHSHHKMGCFFSATDWSQLHDRSLVSNYFLMLIVNIAGDAIAKVAFKAKKESKSPTKLLFYNNHDGFSPLKLQAEEEKEVLVVMDCKVILEEEEITVEESFATRYESVAKAIAEDKKAKEEEYKKRFMGGSAYGAPGKVINGAFHYNEDKHRSKVRDSWEYDPDSGEWINKSAPQKPQSSGKQYYHKLTNDWRPYPEIQNNFPSYVPKKISNMTDKEWEEFDRGGTSPEKWDLRHAKIMLNCSLKDTVTQDPTDCRELLIETNKQVEGNEKKREGVLEEFGLSLIESYQLMFPGKSAEKDAYYDLLEKMLEYLYPYSYIDITANLIEEIKWEMEDVKEDMYKEHSEAMRDMFMM